MAALVTSNEEALERAYRDAEHSWATDAALAYRPMALHLIDAGAIDLHGKLVLDAGAGTGFASEILRTRGADVVAADLELSMLRQAAAHATPIAADVMAMPFRNHAFEIVIAAFVLNHLAAPAAGLVELARVTRRGGSILASTFSIDRAAAKNAIDDVAARHGWVRPTWHDELQRRAAAVGTADRMAGQARSAGLRNFRVTETDLDLGLNEPKLVVRYRLGMPQLARFVATMTSRARLRFVAECESAVAAQASSFRPRVVELFVTVS